MTTFTPTHTFTGTADIDGDEGCSPFTGLPCTILTQRSGYCRAGFNAVVLLQCTAEQLRGRYLAAAAAKRALEGSEWNPPYTIEEMFEWHRASDYPGFENLPPHLLAIDADTEDLTETP